MSANTLNDITANTTWVDITVANPTAAGASVLIQNKSNSSSKRNLVYVSFGTTQPSSNTKGYALEYLNSVTGNSSNIWVRSTGTSILSVTVI